MIVVLPTQKEEHGGFSLFRFNYQFVSSVNSSLTHFMPYYMMTGDQNLLTSDYALYWWDYKAGYNMVLTEFGWNYSRQLAIALDRGAASVRNKKIGEQ